MDYLPPYLLCLVPKDSLLSTASPISVLSQSPLPSTTRYSFCASFVEGSGASAPVTATLFDLLQLGNHTKWKTTLQGKNPKDCSVACLNSTTKIGSSFSSYTSTVPSFAVFTRVDPPGPPAPQRNVTSSASSLTGDSRASSALASARDVAPKPKKNIPGPFPSHGDEVFLSTLDLSRFGFPLDFHSGFRALALVCAANFPDLNLDKPPGLGNLDGFRKLFAGKLLDTGCTKPSLTGVPDSSTSKLCKVQLVAPFTYDGIDFADKNPFYKSAQEAIDALRSGVHNTRKGTGKDFALTPSILTCFKEVFKGGALGTSLHSSFFILSLHSPSSTPLELKFDSAHGNYHPDLFRRMQGIFGTKCTKEELSFWNGLGFLFILQSENASLKGCHYDILTFDPSEGSSKGKRARFGETIGNSGSSTGVAGGGGGGGGEGGGGGNGNSDDNMGERPFRGGGVMGMGAPVPNCQPHFQCYPLIILHTLFHHPFHWWVRGVPKAPLQLYHLILHSQLSSHSLLHPTFCTLLHLHPFPRVSSGYPRLLLLLHPEPLKPPALLPQHPLLCP